MSKIAGGLFAGVMVLAVALPPAAARDPAADILVRVNQARVAAGLAPLVADARLTHAAAAHARDIARRGELDHVGKDGTTLGERLARTGYPIRRAAENLAAGPDAPGEIVDLWLASPPRRWRRAGRDRARRCGSPAARWQDDGR
ncbi:MAG: CAP domain-containing protein [Rhodospirillales bacterium]|nr:CAP domain-containing protein [Rhodospirillales bacterium]